MRLEALADIMSFARAPISSDGAPLSWRKYSGGGFSTTGLGGVFTPLNIVLDPTAPGDMRQPHGRGVPSPDMHPLVRREIVSVARLHAEGRVPSIDVAGGADHAERARRVWIAHGREAHSSLPNQGASANMAAIELLTILGDIARDLTHRAPTISSFVPPYSTLTVGLIYGGSAVNILARECTFAFDLRMTPEADEAAILQPFYDGVADLHRRLRARGSDLGLEVERLAAVPPLAAEPDGRAESLVRALTGDNAPSGVVSFAAEAGQFQRSGMSTVICGPGSIAQAHIADEYIDIDQLRQGANFMIKLAHSLS